MIITSPSQNVISFRFSWVPFVMLQNDATSILSEVLSFHQFRPKRDHHYDVFMTEYMLHALVGIIIRKTIILKRCNLL